MRPMIQVNELMPTTRCECSQWYYEAKGQVWATGCTQDPKHDYNTYAPGHDSKHRGLQIRAERAGAELLHR